MLSRLEQLWLLVQQLSWASFGIIINQENTTSPLDHLVGNASDVADNYTHIHKVLTEWSTIYGDVFSLSMLGNKQLVLSGSEAIREATFNGRQRVTRSERGEPFLVQTSN